ncbi:hypothetical protein K1719_002420 [Acacia pycnantha]|nr:hypothetical protein K1719_002420 [Acacia pycnantha]
MKQKLHATETVNAELCRYVEELKMECQESRMIKENLEKLLVTRDIATNDLVADAKTDVAKAVPKLDSEPVPDEETSHHTVVEFVDKVILLKAIELGVKTQNVAPAFAATKDISDDDNGTAGRPAHHPLR